MNDWQSIVDTFCTAALYYPDVAIDGSSTLLNFTLLDSIPYSIPPEKYSKLLPDPIQYWQWFYERAHRLIQHGHPQNAVKLLELTKGKVSLLDRLLETICEYEKVQSVLFLLNEGSPKVNFEHFAQKRLLSLTNNNSNIDNFALFNDLCSAKVPIFPREAPLLIPNPSPTIDDIIFSSNQRGKSLRDEFEECNSTEEDRIMRIKKVLELIVQIRQSNPSVSLSTWIKIKSHREFENEKSLNELEKFCIEQLEEISEL